MRIVTCVSSLSFGGVQRTAANYSRILKERGHDVLHFAYASDDGPLRSLLNKHGVALATSNAENFFSTLASIKEFKPDIVCVHRTGPKEAWTSELITTLSAYAPIIEVNVFGRVDYSQTRTKIAARIVKSHWCLMRYLEWSRIVDSDAPTYVVENPIPIDRLKPHAASTSAEARRKVGLHHEGPFIGRIAQPIPAKWNLDPLIAFSRLAPSFPDLGLLLVGAPSEIHRYYQGLEPKLKSKVFFVDSTSEDEHLANLYRSLDVFAHSCPGGESFGNSVVESILCGVPVVSRGLISKDFAQLEVLRNGGGVVCLQLDSFVLELEKLLSSSTFRDQQVASGVEHINQHYADDVIGDKIEKLFVRVAEANQAESPSQYLRTYLKAQDLSEARKFIYSLLSKTNDRPEPKDRIQSALVANPYAMKLYSELKESKKYDADQRQILIERSKQMETVQGPGAKRIEKESE